VKKNESPPIQEGVRTPLTDRVNVEPPILHGMAASEAKYIGIAAGCLGLLVAGLLQVMTGLGTLLLIVVLYPEHPSLSCREKSYGTEIHQSF